jgi:hypothetical protein
MIIDTYWHASQVHITARCVERSHARYRITTKYQYLYRRVNRFQRFSTVVAERWQAQQRHATKRLLPHARLTASMIYFKCSYINSRKLRPFVQSCCSGRRWCQTKAAANIPRLGPATSQQIFIPYDVFPNGRSLGLCGACCAPSRPRSLSHLSSMRHTNAHELRTDEGHYNIQLTPAVTNRMQTITRTYR